jgi:hypothetical protein
VDDWRAANRPVVPGRHRRQQASCQVADGSDVDRDRCDRRTLADHELLDLPRLASETHRKTTDHRLGDSTLASKDLR